ncbi:Glucose N-acetyltransferase 1 [Wickerhamomyces ciferrii]|uniref:Glucose N-acetyltransferase 1 n=1 Tax=Wickerhamomyces ciferrii (strain ATCC 14091 / BCRC 22168 / CBS 111 / JCM 3599 / NBRC 0793 / NRRL Y-1031 F-60-10) TaxID=1206466 RepID=K0KLZ3_WICCF|nr:Glucose N-acetyltransferase 1 [Wickerhamomyces ciferrii]CCH44021.1 Glucose N-acetyltransferase 1 [Wickerhamomyces ciferrii]
MSSTRSLLHRLTKINNKFILAIVISISLICLLTTSSSSSNSFLPNLNTSHPNVLQKIKSTSDNKPSNIITDSQGYEILDYDREHIKYISPEIIDSIYNNTDLDSIDWTKYAYILYATSTNHMCNAMMIFAELRKYETRAQLVLLVNNKFLEDPIKHEYEFNTLTSFSKKFNVLLKATQVKTMNDKQDVNIWISSFTKLMVFNETDYNRVIYLDSDAILPQSNLDELFFIPHTKLASVTGYWLTQERYAKQEYLKYHANQYNFKPKSQMEKQLEMNEFISKNISPFQNSKGFLPINNKANETTMEFKINELNFQNNLYNNLPNFPFLDEYSFTNIIMVIEPSKELFQRIEASFDQRKKNEFDMDIINFYVFKLIKSLELQKDRAKPQIESLEDFDSPEFLILPHQRYGVLTSELNTVTDHKSFLADPMDQPFVYQKHGLITGDNEPPYYDLSAIEQQSEKFIPNIKYLHYSDLPIPKPWIEKKIEDNYMSNRLRCSNHKDFIKNPNNKRVKPKGTTKDCSAGKYWEYSHELFEKIRMDVCGLRLKWVDGNAYTNDQN